MCKSETTDPDIVSILKRQMSPTLTMLGRVLEACPDELWADDDGGVPVWQEAYHSLVGVFFWLRDDMSASFEFPPFHSEDAGMMVKGAGPPIARELILDYHRQACERCDEIFQCVTPRKLTEQVCLGGVSFTLADRILGQIRHVQHHTGCMYSLLRRRMGDGPDWAGFGEGEQEKAQEPFSKAMGAAKEVPDLFFGAGECS